MIIKNKIGLVSHILPPSQSGQAVMLGKVLKALPSTCYCLISTKNYTNNQSFFSGPEMLSGHYYYLKPAVKLKSGNIKLLSSVIKLLNFLRELLIRARQIERYCRIERCSLIIACSGDLYDLPASYLASKRLNIPLIPYIFDYYSYQWVGKEQIIAKKMEPFILKHAFNIIVPNEFLQREYQKRYNVNSTVIYNPCLLPDLKNLDDEDNYFDINNINIVYTGSIYHAHYDAFWNIISAIERLHRDDIRLHIFTAQPIEELKKNNILKSFVVYHSHIPPAKVSSVLRQADLLFLPLAFDSTIPEVIRTSAPGKAGEYLSVGRPILVHAPFDSFVSWYFNVNKCGRVASHKSIIALSESLNEIILDEKLRDDLSKKAREQAERDFDITISQDRFLSLINQPFTRKTKFKI